MGALATGIYNSIFRRNYVMLTTVFIGAFGFEMAFDTTTDAIWSSINRGRQWKDIKQRYMQSDDE